MSGGAFDYFYSNMGMTVDKMREDIHADPDSCEEEYKMISLMEGMTKLMYELEWYRSSDTNQKDFKKAFKKFERRWLKERR